MIPTPLRRATATAGASICAFVLAAGTAHAELPPDELRALTDHYLYEVPLAEFHGISTERPHADQLDWTSDGCSLSPDHPLGFDFAVSCDRHDFGYRNYPRQDRFSEADRLRVDDNFRRDLHTSCGPDRICAATAEVYYFAVREFGGVSRSTAEALHKAGVEQHGPGQFTATGRSGDVVEFGPLAEQPPSDQLPSDQPSSDQHRR